MRLCPSKWYRDGSRKKKKIEKALVLIKMKRERFEMQWICTSVGKTGTQETEQCFEGGAQQINLPLANNQSVLFGESSSRGYWLAIRSSSGLQIVSNTPHY